MEAVAEALGLQKWQVIFLVAPVASYYAACLVFHSLDSIPGLEKYRIQAKVQEKRNKVDWKEALPWVILQHCLQLILGTLLCMTEEYSEEWDEWYIALPKIVLGTFILDTYQYWVHRWMHVNRWLFNNFHSWHHRLYCPYAIGALYNHPVEGLVLDAGSGAAAVALAGMDLRTASLFVAVSTIKTVCDHSNYYFWWNPLMSLFTNNGEYHDYHHQLRGFRFNFAQPYYTFWDQIMGTLHMPTPEELIKINGKGEVMSEDMPDVANDMELEKEKKKQ